MGQVIQIPPDDWYLLKIIKQSTAMLQSKNDHGKYTKVIEKERKMARNIIERYTIH